MLSYSKGPSQQTGGWVKDNNGLFFLVLKASGLRAIWSEIYFKLYEELNEGGLRY